MNYRLSPDERADIDRKWMMMTHEHRLVFVGLDELGECSMAELAAALQDEDFYARVSARIDKIHQRVEAAMVAGGEKP